MASAVKNKNTIDVGPLLGPGRRTIAVDARIELPAFEDLRFAGPLHVVLDLRGVDRGIRIEGTIDGDVLAECRRCLEEVLMPLHLDVDERVGSGEETGPSCGKQRPDRRKTRRRRSGAANYYDGAADGRAVLGGVSRALPAVRAQSKHGRLLVPACKGKRSWPILNGRRRVPRRGAAARQTGSSRRRRRSSVRSVISPSVRTSSVRTAGRTTAARWSSPRTKPPAQRG